MTLQARQGWAGGAGGRHAWGSMSFWIPSDAHMEENLSEE